MAGRKQGDLFDGDRSVGQSDVARDLVAHFVDVSKEVAGLPEESSFPPRKVTGKLAAQVRDLLAEKMQPGDIRAGIEMMVERGLDPTLLPSCVFSARLNPDLKIPRDDREALKTFLAGHGGRWPTGARFVRSAISGTFVYDPLGYDRCNYSDWPHSRPTKREIIDALKKKRG